MMDSLKALWYSALMIVGSFFENKRGASLLTKIIELSIACLVFSILGVLAIRNLIEANTTGWDTQTIAVYNFLPIFFILAVAIGIIYVIIRAKR